MYCLRRILCAYTWVEVAGARVRRLNNQTTYINIHFFWNFLHALIFSNPNSPFSPNIFSYYYGCCYYDAFVAVLHTIRRMRSARIHTNTKFLSERVFFFFSSLWQWLLYFLIMLKIFSLFRSYSELERKIACTETKHAKCSSSLSLELNLRICFPSNFAYNRYYIVRYMCNFDTYLVIVCRKEFFFYFVLLEHFNVGSSLAKVILQLYMEGLEMKTSIDPFCLLQPNCFLSTPKLKYLQSKPTHTFGTNAFSIRKIYQCFCLLNNSRSW